MVIITKSSVKKQEIWILGGGLQTFIVLIKALQEILVQKHCATSTPEQKLQSSNYVLCGSKSVTSEIMITIDQACVKEQDTWIFYWKLQIFRVVEKTLQEILVQKRSTTADSENKLWFTITLYVTSKVVIIIDQDCVKERKTWIHRKKSSTANLFTKALRNSSTRAKIVIFLSCSVQLKVCDKRRNNNQIMLV